jgi:DNA-binding NtrC family response regulator
MVVEDEVLIAFDLVDMLQSEGAAVVAQADSVDEALKLLSDSITIDCVLLDFNLKGESAAPVARHLISAGKPFLILTAYEVSLLPEEFRACEIMPKPYDHTRLIKSISRLVVR